MRSTQLDTVEAPPLRLEPSTCPWRTHLPCLSTTRDRFGTLRPLKHGLVAMSHNTIVAAAVSTSHLEAVLWYSRIRIRGGRMQCQWCQVT